MGQATPAKVCCCKSKVRGLAVGTKERQELLISCCIQLGTAGQDRT